MSARPIPTAIAALARRLRRLRLAGLTDAPGDQRGRPLVAGFLSAPSGIGTGARLMLDAFEAAGLDPAAMDLTERFQPERADIDWRRGRALASDDGCGPVIVHANAPEAPFILSELGKDRLRGRLRIAYWAWEFERLPAGWARELDWFHECWTPSTFTAEAVRAAAPGATVRAVGHPLSAAQPDPAGVASWRARFGAAPGALALHVFDMRSSLERKNPLGAIDMFKRGAGDHPGARLVVKAGSWGWRPQLDHRLSQAVESDARIHLITEVLDEPAMTNLVAAADIYLSPHRCEGYGLLLAAALSHGGQVIMTGWSGNGDFAHLPGAHVIPATLTSVRDSSGVYDRRAGRWAEPDLAAGAERLSALLSGAVNADRAMIAEAAQTELGLERWLERLGSPFRSRLKSALLR